MLYSKLNVSYMSLNVILRGLIVAILKATTDGLTQILKIN